MGNAVFIYSISRITVRAVSAPSRDQLREQPEEVNDGMITSNVTSRSAHSADQPFPWVDTLICIFVILCDASVKAGLCVL